MTLIDFLRKGHLKPLSVARNLLLFFQCQLFLFSRNETLIAVLTFFSFFCHVLYNNVVVYNLLFFLERGFLILELLSFIVSTLFHLLRKDRIVWDILHYFWFYFVKWDILSALLLSLFYCMLYILWYCTLWLLWCVDVDVSCFYFFFQLFRIYNETKKKNSRKPITPQYSVVLFPCSILWVDCGFITIEIFPYKFSNYAVKPT